MNIPLIAMKKFKLPVITMMILTFGFIQQSNAQKQRKGLYLTYADFLSHKLSYTEDPAKPNGNKIAIHEFLGMNKVTVNGRGKTLVFDKGKLFGYHDEGGNDYRFAANRAYQVIDTGGFYIYSYDKLIQQGKGPKPTRVYYFSKTISSPLLPLTFKNIENAFQGNRKFRYMVEVASVDNVKPDAYDNEKNAYKIKELYTASLK
jgi:hypothetical protein